MKPEELTEALIGKRVRTISFGTSYVGTVVRIVEEHNPVDGQNRKGLQIKLDYPIQWGENEYDTIYIYPRSKYDFGNLYHTELI